MKKRVLSVLLVIALLVTVGIIAAQADGTTPTPSEVIAAAAELQGEFPTDGSTYDAPCPHCGGEENVTWKPLSGTTGALFGGHYYVDAEVVERTTVISAYYGETCLHLNGNKINTTGRGVFETSNYGVNVMGEGEATCNARDIFETVKFETNVYGGTYSNTAGGIITLKDGADFNFYGGKIGDTTAATDIWTSGNFNVLGGEIASPTLLVPNGDAATVNVGAGKISGAGVSMNNGVINVTGGQISLLTRTADTDAINISGTAKIDNLNLTQGSTLVNVGEMTDGAKVKVTVADGVAFTNEGVAEAAKYFASAKDGYEVVADENGALKSTEANCDTWQKKVAYANEMSFEGTANVTKYCPACNAPKEWKAITDSTAAITSGGHWYFSDLAATRTKAIAAANVCVHLNNKTVTISDVAFQSASGKVVNIMGNGTVNSTNAVTINAFSGTVNVYGGNFNSTKADIVRNITNSTGVVNFYAGTIGASTGKAVSVTNGNAFNMYGGTIAENAMSVVIDNGSLTIEGGIVGGTGIDMTNGALTVKGGTIGKITGTSGTTAINLSGNPQITTLDLTASAVKANVTNLANTARIGVKADGAFTTGDASAYKDCFTALTEGHVILVDEATGVLSSGIYVKRYETPDEIMEYANNMTFPTSGDSKQLCPVCNEEVTWKEMPTGQVLVQSKAHYYVASDITRTAHFFTYKADACVHLNGKTITHTTDTSNNAFIVSKNLNLMGRGTVQSNIMAIGPNGGTTNVYGGNYISGEDVLLRSGTINLYAGSMSGSTVKVGNAAVLNVENASVSAVTTEASFTGAINLSGVVEIASLNVASGKTLGTLALESGSEIGITASGAFTGAGNAPYKDYFKPATGYTVSADAEGVLSCAVKTYTIDEVAAYAETMKFTGTGTQTALCPKCNKTVSWTEVTADSNHLIGAADGGHYYLSGNITRDKTLLAYKGDVCFFFNGNTLTYNASASGHEKNAAFGAFVNGDNINDITFMGKGGIVTEKNQAALTNGATINVCGGTYTVADEAESVLGVNDAKGVIKAYAGTFNCAGLGAGEGVVNVLGNITGDVMGNNVNVNAEFVGVAGPWDDNAVINTTVDVTVDVRGKKNVTVNGTGNVTAMDSYSKGAFQTDGYATFADTLTSVTAADNFVKIDDEIGTHLYYYSMKVSGVSLKNKDDKVGLYYKGAWFMDAALRELVDVGVVISLVEAPNVDFYEQYEAALSADGGHKFFFTSYAGNTVGNGVNKTSILLDGIMKESANADRYATNKANGEKGIYAAAFMMLEDGTVVVSNSRCLSVHDVLDLIDGNEEAYTKQASVLTKFYNQWKNSITDWVFERIGKEAE